MKVLASPYIFRIIVNQMGKIRILIIEDDADLAEDLKYSLEEIGYEVTGIAPDSKKLTACFIPKNRTLSSLILCWVMRREVSNLPKTSA